MGRDPIEEEGGLNLYGFVLNNPINLWDYLGMDPPIDPATAGYVIAGGSATRPMGVVGHYFVGTVSPTGQFQVLDYGANNANLGALISTSDVHANIMNFATPQDFSGWATRMGYTVFATYVGESQLGAANNMMQTIAANPGNYSGLQIDGDSCITASSAVLAAAGIQTPAQTQAAALADHVAAGGEPYMPGVFTGAQALFYTQHTPGFARVILNSGSSPDGGGRYNGPVEPGTIMMDRFIVRASDEPDPAQSGGPRLIINIRDRSAPYVSVHDRFDNAAFGARTSQWLADVRNPQAAQLRAMVASGHMTARQAEMRLMALQATQTFYSENSR